MPRVRNPLKPISRNAVVPIHLKQGQLPAAQGGESAAERQSEADRTGRIGVGMRAQRLIALIALRGITHLEEKRGRKAGEQAYREFR